MKNVLPFNLFERAEQKFKVIKGYNGRPFSGTFGSSFSSVRYVPGSSGRRIEIPVGDIITFESEAPDGKVWFYHNDKRFYTESGSVKNMLRAGVIEPV